MQLEPYYSCSYNLLHSHQEENEAIREQPCEVELLILNKKIIDFEGVAEIITSKYIVINSTSLSWCAFPYVYDQLKKSNK